jgi:glutamyl-tRNA reductase
MLVVGCNHRSAPVEVRERISFAEGEAARALDGLRRRHGDCEAVILSTCNRMEVYVAAGIAGHPDAREVTEFIAEFHGLVVDEFATGLYVHEGREVARHLFEVVCSLDSMVLGETQILGQAKQCLEWARTAGTAGRGLDGLFQRAFAVAKEVHTRTSIAAGRVSVGSTAVDLARQIFSHFDDKIVMMIGAGEMGELTLTHLLETGPKRLWVTNRTDARAVALAEKIAAKHNVPVEAVPFAQWIEHLAEADIAIASTGASEPILTARDFAPVPARRRYRPLLLIDISVPRNIEQAVAEAEGVFLYNVDDLQAVVESTLAQRREAANDCRQIIAAHVVDYFERQSRQDLGPLIAALQQRFRGVAESELQRIWPKLGSVSEADRQLIEQMLHRVTQKLLHEPITRLNDSSANGDAQAYADALRVVFDLAVSRAADEP